MPESIDDLTIRMEMDERQVISAHRAAARAAADDFGARLRDRLIGGIGQRLAASNIPGTSAAGNLLSIVGLPGARPLSLRTQAAGRLARSNLRAGRVGAAAAAGVRFGAGALAATGPVGVLIAAILAAVAAISAVRRIISGLNQRMDTLTARIAAVSPDVAIAQAQDRAARVLSSIRDAGLFGGALSARQRLQTDTRERLRNVGRVFDVFQSIAAVGLATIVNAVVRVVEKAVSVMLALRNALTNAVAALLRGFASLLQVLPVIGGDTGAAILRDMADALDRSTAQLEQIRRMIRDATDRGDMTEVNRMMLSGLDTATGGRWQFPGAPASP